MILFFGGAYNGKVKCVKEKYNIKNDEIFFANSKNIDFSKKVISNIEKLIFLKIENNEDPVEYFKNNLDKLRDKIIICDDITSGIVPIKKEERLWREKCGEVLQILSKESDEVFRIFFGIETKIKGER